jgi:sulfur-oxidizing protein SoxY
LKHPELAAIEMIGTFMNAERLARQRLTSTSAWTRRRVIVLAGGAAASAWAMPLLAATDDLTAAVSAYTGGATPKPGKVRLEIAELIDNGNVVPITVTVESSMNASDHVKAIAVFNEKNPQRDVARFTLGARYGKASVGTRIRLSTSQRLVAVAQMSDGTFWSDSKDVIVTLAACIES